VAFFLSRLATIVLFIEDYTINTCWNLNAKKYEIKRYTKKETYEKHRVDQKNAGKSTLIAWAPAMAASATAG
jgi:hypothetical protein